LDTVADNWQRQEPSSCTCPYTKVPGSTLTFPDGTTKLNIFFRFFTPEVWNLLVTETNRYAAANLPDPANTLHPRYWKDVTVSDMKAFVGLLILMGVVHLPRLEMYWPQSNPYIATKGISDVMTKKSLSRYIASSIWPTMMTETTTLRIKTNFSKSENWQTCYWLAFKGIMSHIKQFQLMKL